MIIKVFEKFEALQGAYFLLEVACFFINKTDTVEF